MDIKDSRFADPFSPVSASARSCAGCKFNQGMHDKAYCDIFPNLYDPKPKDILFDGEDCDFREPAN